MPNNYCSSPETKRIAYYFWHFPLLSETFIQREVLALQKHGLALTLIADAADKDVMLDKNAQALKAQTHYLLPLQKRYLVQYSLYFTSHYPSKLWRLWRRLRSGGYGVEEGLGVDLRVFLKVIYVAGTLLKHNIQHAHSPWADTNAFILMQAAALLDLPYSVQARAHDIHRDNRRVGLYERLSAAKFIVTNTRYNVDYLKTILKASEHSKIKLIYNGLDLACFQPRITQLSVVHKPIFLCVARLIEQKGLLDLLHACCILQEQGYEFLCHIIGAPELPDYNDYYQDLKNLRQELKLEDKVHLLGPQSFDKVMTAYQQANIFVLPCVFAADGSRDITPNALIEAMAMGLPVISTPITGIPEIVDDEINGLLVPPEEPRLLADAMLRLLLAPHLSQRLGQAARKKVAKQFNIRQNSRAYIKLFTPF